jgi:hypothetical protein
MPTSAPAQILLQSSGYPSGQNLPLGLKYLPTQYSSDAIAR